ncbi:hydroxymethylglutaryl-CoA lyase [Gordonia sp. NPDC003424]
MNDVSVVEVSPRDGLQNEDVHLSVAERVDLITRLVEAGASRIEAVSFAHPRLVPAMAGAEAVMAAVPRRPGVSYAGLVLNRRGLERAMDCGIDEVNVVVCASDLFSRRNQNVSAEDAMAAAQDVVARARTAGLFTTVTIATAFGCVLEGEIHRERVASLAAAAADVHTDELCLADSVGVGVPDQVLDLVSAVAPLWSPDRLRFHFHNTRNTGYANAVAALDAGIRTLDASAGGIGGCPFAPNATGNIATEDLLYLLDRSGYRTGWDAEALPDIADFLATHLAHPVPSLMPKAGGFPHLSRQG